MSLRRPLLITLAASNLNTALMFGVSLVVARYVSPSDVGIFSLAVVIINTAAVFRDWGVGPYLIAHRELSPADVGAALGLNLALALGLAALLLLLAEPLAALFGQAEIATALRVLTLSFLLVPWAAVLTALLQRELQAGQQALAAGIGALGYALVCLSLAIAGWGFLAMAWANVTNLALTIAALLYLRRGQPALRAQAAGWPEVLRAGAGTVTGQLVTVLHQSLPDVWLGRSAGVHAVGLFSRANGVIGLFLQLAGAALNFGAQPYVAQQSRSGADLQALLARGQAVLLGCAWPVYALLGLFAHDLIALLYGPTWLEAAPLASILALSAALRVEVHLFQPALLALGHSFAAARLVSVNLLARLLLLLLIRPASLTDFALSLLAADLLCAPYTRRLFIRASGLPGAGWWAPWLQSLALGLLCAGALLLCRALLPADWPSLARLLAALASLGLSWVLGVRLLRHPLGSELDWALQRLRRPAAPPPRP